MKVFFISLLLILIFSGCVNQDPQITNIDVYRYEVSRTSGSHVVKQVPTNRFKFVKRGNIYYMEKIVPEPKDEPPNK